MLHTKSQGHGPSGSGEEIFKGFFYHILSTWWPSWSCDQEHVNKLLFWPPKLSPYESYEFNWPSGFREDV